jgi:hypothetical protein
MYLYNNNIIKLSTLILSLLLPTTTNAIGHNGRIDMLHTINHKEEIDMLLNKKYTGDSAPALTGDIHHVKEVVDDGRSSSKNNKGGRGDNASSKRKALLMAAKNGYMINTELDNVVTNILEASVTVERESMI